MVVRPVPGGPDPVRFLGHLAGAKDPFLLDGAFDRADEGARSYLGLDAVALVAPEEGDALAHQLDSLEHPRIEKARWKAWGQKIAAVQEPLAGAAREHEIAEARTSLAERSYRVAVRMAWFDLMRLKRDLKNIGLSEAEIHTVIPDRPRPRRARPEQPGASSSAPPGGVPSA